MDFSPAHIKQLAEACLAASEFAADADGFVSVRSLLNRFQARLMLRPLLVEAMICELSPEEIASASDGARWLVLVDNERYSIDSAQIELETSRNPLPARFRYTVAHELTHLITFRPTEFGVKLMLRSRRRSGAAQEVKKIEEVTDDLTPLILIPSRSIDRWFPASLPSLTASHVSQARQALGVSRFVLLNRLNLVSWADKGQIRERRCLVNVAVGLGEWRNEGAAVLREWPQYQRFERLVPQVLLRLGREKSLDARDIFSEPEFVLNGGSEYSITSAARGGTLSNPSVADIELGCTVEQTRGRNTTFLFVMTAIESGYISARG